MPEQKKLFLLDAFALIYRAYFAFSSNPRITSKGMNTSAMFGFTNTLLEVLNKEKPTHIAVVFDTAAPTARHEEFTDYKANRQEVPEDISSAIPYVHRLCEAFKIPAIGIDGYEADDVIGTLACKAEKAGFDTYMMTPDKDFGQLVDEHTFIYKPAAFGKGPETLGIKEVCARWEIERVDQVKDILGLMGDSVDNIPGIPGVGEKTAMKLVKEFGSVENLIQNTDKLKGALKEKVEKGKDMAVQSKRLATITTDVPMNIVPDDLKMQEPDKDALRALFAELEFRNFAQRMGLEERSTITRTSPLGDNGAVRTTPARKKVTAVVTTQVNLFGENITDEETQQVLEALTEMPPMAESETEPVRPYDSILTVKHNYEIVETAAKIKQLVTELAKQPYISFDTETTGVDVNDNELVGMSFSFKPNEGYYVPVPANYNEAHKVVAEFKEVFENEKIDKIGQNIKFDMSVLKWYDVDVKGKLFDTMVAHFLIRPETSHSMDAMAHTYLNYTPVSIETLIGKRGKDQKSMRDAPLDQIAEYAAEDADITLQLKDQFAPKLERIGVQRLFDEVEMPLVPVLAAMEAEGINVDKGALNELSVKLSEDIVKSEMEIQYLAGAKFNVSSPRQVGEVLFGQLKIMEKAPKTKTGQYSTSEDVLIKLENKHPIIKHILDYRELVKLKNTYVDTLPLLVNPRTGRIHTSYNQVVAVTGRLSSDNPNLQNIPIRTERGREIRKAFIPRNDKYTLLSADYSQIELRIIAELSGDTGMIDAFKSGEDIHATTASKVYSVELKDVTGDMRRNAKMVNFGIIYGISAFGLGDRLGIPRGEAKAIIENYFKQYPQIQQYMHHSIEMAREKGYVETIMGRKRFLRDINSANATVRGFAERNAINAPIQGSAADMIKIAMINIHADMQKKKFKSKMLLQVHDELVFDVLKEEADEMKSIVEHRMKTALNLQVPVDIGMGAGVNWLVAH